MNKSVYRFYQKVIHNLSTKLSIGFYIVIHMLKLFIQLNYRHLYTLSTTPTTNTTIIIINNFIKKQQGGYPH